MPQIGNTIALIPDKYNRCIRVNSPLARSDVGLALSRALLDACGIDKFRVESPGIRKYSRLVGIFSNCHSESMDFGISEMSESQHILPIYFESGQGVLNAYGWQTEAGMSFHYALPGFSEDYSARLRVDWDFHSGAYLLMLGREARFEGIYEGKIKPGKKIKLPHGAIEVKEVYSDASGNFFRARGGAIYRTTSEPNTAGRNAVNFIFCMNSGEQFMLPGAGEPSMAMPWGEKSAAALQFISGAFASYAGTSNYEVARISKH